ncbi:MAG: hypothetical protein CMB80_33460 [Flammeovirgaceae bacterium]|nr:hypothetical protein [Flammeovirgaceae bacterium]MBR07588.1 hypothetical protein [Rickettsiales bacterium]HCX25185.1 hypothetical protein [Cytophagales bacterium]|tara:strand:+ start:237 stop:449 length:213 start_codon:yes stop_codon:yes gene_type:complete
MKKHKKEEPEQKPKVNKELDGFDVSIDSFGELKSTIDIDKINQFLNNHVDDKKLRDREDLDELKKGNEEE